jgi:hypothetical protein
LEKNFKIDIYYKNFAFVATKAKKTGKGGHDIKIMLNIRCLHP